MKKVFVVFIAVIMMLSFTACAAKSGEQNAEVPSTETKAPDTQFTIAPTDVPTVVPTAEPTPEPMQATEIGLGEKITLPFVEITFDSFDIKDDIRKTIKTSSSGSYTFGPEPESGKKFIVINSTIKNLHNREIPIDDFFEGEFDVDGYIFKCEWWLNHRAYNSNGDQQVSISPLSSCSVMFYMPIPNELSSSSPIYFRFGFCDLFDHSELMNYRLHQSDPISCCPYQYKLKLK